MHALIFFSMHLPSPDVPQAGQKICYGHLKKISDIRAVDLVAYTNKHESGYFNPDIYTDCKTSTFLRLTNLRRLINFLTNPLQPLKVAIRNDKRAIKRINDLLSDDSLVDEIMIEYEQGAFIIPKLRKRVRTTVVFHDVISQSIARRQKAASLWRPSRYFHLLQLRLAERWERGLAKYIDTAIVLSEKDRVLLENLGFDPHRVRVEYPAVAPKFYTADRSRYEPDRILFWGAMDRDENQDAVIWFVRYILPAIKQSIPGIKFTILGANPGTEVLRLVSDVVQVTGFVDDPLPYFETAALSVAPLRYGAGIKLKVLEALAAKLPVVATSVAAEGISATSNELEIADDEASFAQAVIGKLSHTSRH